MVDIAGSLGINQAFRGNVRSTPTGTATFRRNPREAEQLQATARLSAIPALPDPTQTVTASSGGLDIDFQLPQGRQQVPVVGQGGQVAPAGQQGRQTPPPIRRGQVLGPRQKALTVRRDRLKAVTKGPSEGRPSRKLPTPNQRFVNVNPRRVL